MSPPESGAGLRERKKARTRAAIRSHALRLFHDQGYEQTTVDQIAEAAEVSPSTFFRYFPTKEDVVLQDDYDAPLIAAFQAQPAHLPPTTALRNALHDVFASVAPDERDQELARAALIFSVPELRARMLDQFAGVIEMIADAVAHRTGRRTDEFEIRVFAGALVGIALAVVMESTADPTFDYLKRFDATLAHLEAGLVL